MNSAPRRPGSSAPPLVLTIALALGMVGCSAPGPGIERGEALWDTCVPCHGAGGEGNRALAAPAIGGLPEWYLLEQLQKFDRGWRGSHPMDTVGIRMRSMVRSLDLEGDVESVAAFAASLATPDPPPTLEGGDPTAGEAAYNRLCVACHQPDAVGFEGVRAPPLTGQHDWYLLAQYEKFRSGRRGADPEDTFGQTMMVGVSQVDAEELIDILAYLRGL